MENYIVINGRKAELTKEQLEKLGIKVENPEEKYPPKFKVGDRVRVICSTKTLGRGEEYEGGIFTIKSVFKLADYSYGFASNIRAYSIGENYVIYENELELVSYAKIFERLDYGSDFYYISSTGYIYQSGDLKADTDNKLFNSANYCHDAAVMKQRALHETLNRLLWRASVIAGELDNPWNGRSPHYVIMNNNGFFSVRKHDEYKYLEPHFPTLSAAEDAIENIIKPFIKEHPDFVW